jgi:hypothetical protein
MVGFAAMPGTAVEPMCSIASNRATELSSAIAAAARRGQSGSYATITGTQTSCHTRKCRWIDAAP